MRPTNNETEGQMKSLLTRFPVVSVGEESGNLLVRGDNIEALERLNGDLAGEVRCVYVDPPYNNGERYFDYDDRAHDAWLEEQTDVLEALFGLLAVDGSMWVSIDDGEAHHLKVALDRRLGRRHFVGTIVWNQRKTRENRAVFSFNHEYILVYARSPDAFAKSRNDLPLTPEILKRYKNPDDDPRGPWQSVSANAQDGHATPSQFYEIVAPSGERHTPPNGRCWIYNESKMRAEIEAGNVWFGRDGRGVPRLKKFLKDRDKGITPHTLWTADEVGTTREAKREILDLFPSRQPFATPKPERLLSRIIRIASDPGDLVVDAYLGSGTTAAVAHKLGRRYVGIDSSESAMDLAVRRLRRVVEGDRVGVSAAERWSGGGGFRVARVDE